MKTTSEDSQRFTITPKGWSGKTPALDQRDENVIRFEVSGPGLEDDCVTFDATTTAEEGKTWEIVRNGKSGGKKYATPLAAREALEAECPLLPDERGQN